MCRCPRGLLLATGETVTFNCTFIVSPISEEFALAVWDVLLLMGGNGATRVGRGPLNGNVVGRLGATRLLLLSHTVIIGWLSAELFTLPPSRDRSPVLPPIVVVVVLLYGIRLLLPAASPTTHLDDLSTLLSRLLLPLLPPLWRLLLLSSLLSFRSLMRRFKLVLCIDCDG